MTEQASRGPSPPPLMERLMTVPEVARALNVSKMSVYRLINRGHLRAARVGRSYQVRTEDVRHYLQRRFLDAG